jgi:DNA repair protein RecO (recombination protein O)
VLHKTKGIVLRFTPYSESTIIVNVFTELFGLQAYIVNGIRAKSIKGNKIALFQPLTLLDMVVYHKENANINRIKEYRCYYPYQYLTVDIKKSSIAIFIHELLNKCLKDESHAQDVFDFVSDSLKQFDNMQHGVENFHLIMMIKLSKYLGFAPANISELLAFRFASEEEENLLKVLLQTDFNVDVKLNNSLRRAMLEQLIAFYNEHIEGFGEMRSMNVLREVLE